MKASVKIADDIYKNSSSHSNGRSNTVHCVVVKSALSGIPLQLCSQHRTKLSRVLWVDFCCRQVFPDVLSEFSWRITKKRWRLQQTTRLLEMNQSCYQPRNQWALESVQQHRQITESKICVFIGHFNFKGLRDTTIIICKQQWGRMELPAQSRLHFCDCILVICAELEVSILRKLLSITPLRSGRHQIILNLFYSRTTAAA